MKTKKQLYSYLKIGLTMFTLLVCSCKKENDKPTGSDMGGNGSGDTTGIPTEFFKDPTKQITPTFTSIANSSSKIATPMDLDFNPFNVAELWIINRGSTIDKGTLEGSTVMITNAGTATQKYTYTMDNAAQHFMVAPSGIAFNPTKPNNTLKYYSVDGISNYFATSQNASNNSHAMEDGSTVIDFMGPTLWPSDPTVYGTIQGPENSCHIDMLHQTPFGKGIAAQAGSPGGIFWIFDGDNKNLCMYNFVTPHEPGGDVHKAGKVHRYTDVVLTGRTDGVPSHMVLDEGAKWLYIVDGGTKRILRVDITTGTKKRDLTPSAEPIDEYWEMTGITQEVFASTGLKEPCGIEIKGDKLFVSDYSTGEIIAYNTATKAEVARVNSGKPGITGIKIGPDGKIYFVNALTSEVSRVDPN